MPDCRRRRSGDPKFETMFVNYLLEEGECGFFGAFGGEAFSRNLRMRKMQAERRFGFVLNEWWNKCGEALLY